VVGHRRRNAEAARDGAVVDRGGVEQHLAERPLIQTHVGQELAAADQTPS
jgi:hypothetical protein